MTVEVLVLVVVVVLCSNSRGIPLNICSFAFLSNRIYSLTHSFSHLNDDDDGGGMLVVDHFLTLMMTSAE